MDHVNYGWIPWTARPRRLIGLPMWRRGLRPRCIRSLIAKFYFRMQGWAIAFGSIAIQTRTLLSNFFRHIFYIWRSIWHFPGIKMPITMYWLVWNSKAWFIIEKPESFWIFAININTLCFFCSNCFIYLSNDFLLSATDISFLRNIINHSVRTYVLFRSFLWEITSLWSKSFFSTLVFLEMNIVSILPERRWREGSNLFSKCFKMSYIFCWSTFCFIKFPTIKCLPDVKFSA